jgi:hypothetical protein
MRSPHDVLLIIVFMKFSYCIGEWDGAGAVVKTQLRNEQLKNPERRL